MPNTIGTISNKTLILRWVISKIPKLKDSDNKLIKEGRSYLYYDSNQYGSFLHSDKSIDSPTNAVSYTLSQIYDSAGNVGYAIYSDEPPGKKVFGYYAHSKGTVGYDSTSGFWLVHSVPKFPPKKEESHYYPKSGRDNGQSMLCMSLPLSEINSVGRQLQTTGPHFYSFSMPNSLKDTLPNLYDATLSKKQIHYPIRVPSSRIATLKSKGGMEFTSFAKSKTFVKDLYAGLVSPSLKKSLLAETWIRTDKVNICCEPEETHCQYNVYNVNYLKFNKEVSYKETKDHSKWAVALDKSTLCIGDINRMVS